MLTQFLRTVSRASSKVRTRPLPFYTIPCAADWPASCWCKQCESGRPNYSYILTGVRHFSSRDNSDHAENSHSRKELNQSDIDELSDDDTSDTTYSDHEIFEAFQSELTLDDDNEENEAQASQRGAHSTHLSQEESLKDEQGKKPWNRKERVKACLDKLKRGPDGRYINVFEVATEVDMLIASYLKLRAQDDPSLAENSDDDERLLEGIDIEKFKRLQKRLRDGTYEFQPIVQVPLPKKRIVKRKKKKVKKEHAF
eukprot:c20868_g1_i4 orf=746-1510(-)